MPVHGPITVHLLASYLLGVESYYLERPDRDGQVPDDATLERIAADIRTHAAALDELDAVVALLDEVLERDPDWWDTEYDRDLNELFGICENCQHDDTLLAVARALRARLPDPPRRDAPIDLVALPVAEWQSQRAAAAPPAAPIVACRPPGDWSGTTVQMIALFGADVPEADRAALTAAFRAALGFVTTRAHIAWYRCHGIVSVVGSAPMTRRHVDAIANAVLALGSQIPIRRVTTTFLG